jgi:hypothetical protein
MYVLQHYCKIGLADMKMARLVLAIFGLKLMCVIRVTVKDEGKALFS